VIVANGDYTGFDFHYSGDEVEAKIAEWDAAHRELSKERSTFIGDPHHCQPHDYCRYCHMWLRDGVVPLVDPYDHATCDYNNGRGHIRGKYDHGHCACWDTCDICQRDATYDMGDHKLYELLADMD